MAVAYGMSPAIDLQYMFCEDFLVRPIVELGQRKVNVIFPEDGFCDFYTGTYYAKGECEVDAPLEQIPLFVKPGSVIPYNYYGEDVVPTWEKENYREAVLLTAPTYERESVFYTDEGACTFASIPGECGYKVVASKPCKRRMVMAIGKVEIVADSVIVESSYDEAKNRTIAVLPEDWTVLEVK